MSLSSCSTSNTTALFDKKSSYLLGLVCLSLLFIPKINLVTFGRETAGIRVDDLLLFSFATLTFSAHVALRRHFLVIERGVIIIVAFSLLSFISNRFLVATGLLHVDASIFYAVRLFEYFLFFYVGILLAPYIGLYRIVAAFFIWNLLIITLQKAGIVGGFSVYGYLPLVTSRFPGIASFPSEMGVLFNMIYSFLIFNNAPPSKLWRLLPTEIARLLIASSLYWLTALTAIFIILTGSRIALVALAVTFCFRVCKEFSLRSPLKLATIACIITLSLSLLTHLVTKTLSIYERSSGLFAFANIELVQTVWTRIDTHYEPIGNEVVDRGHGETPLYDESWWMRIHKWGYAFKIYAQHPLSWLQGIGPGFAMTGLDGGYLRILTEYGIIGTILFWRFFAQLWRLSLTIKWVIVAIMINMIFFDVYLAYKPMALLFLICGYAIHDLKDNVKVGD